MLRRVKQLVSENKQLAAILESGKKVTAFKFVEVTKNEAWDIQAYTRGRQGPEKLGDQIRVNSLVDAHAIASHFGAGLYEETAV